MTKRLIYQCYGECGELWDQGDLDRNRKCPNCAGECEFVEIRLYRGDVEVTATESGKSEEVDCDED